MLVLRQHERKMFKSMTIKELRTYCRHRGTREEMLEDIGKNILNISGRDDTPITQFCVIVNREKCYMDIKTYYNHYNIPAFKKINDIVYEYHYGRVVDEYKYINNEWRSPYDGYITNTEFKKLLNVLYKVTVCMEVRYWYVKLTLLKNRLITDVIKYIGIILIKNHDL